MPTVKQPSLPEPEKLLAEARPKVRQQLQKRIRQIGPALKEISQGALMGVFLGGIAAPLAALGAGPLAGIITQIVSGVGGNLLANFIQRYYDADSAGDEAAKQAILEEINRHLHEESQNSRNILAALQELLDKVDALAAAQEAVEAREAQWLGEQFLALRLIPADLSTHRRFAGEVKKLLRLQGAHIQENFRLSDDHRADFLVTHKGFARSERTIVQCVTTTQGRADEKLLDPILRRLHNAQKESRADFGIIITDSGLSPQAQSLAEDFGWEVRRYDGLLADLMDFTLYLEKRCDDFTQPRPDRDLPALSEYYVALKAKEKRAAKDAKTVDLFQYVQNWISRPSPAQPLMLLGEYGTGKTTFCRKLAYELAENYRQAQDRVAAGHPLNAPRPRLPLLINLLDFVEIRKLDALITHYLGYHCGVDRPRYEVFEALNEAGFFVIILDGFDEMAVRVDSAAVEKHLKQIEQLAAPRESRVLLTGRPEFFMSREEMERSLWPRERILPERFKNYNALQLELWDDEQIQEFLNRFAPHLPNRLGSGKEYYRRIQAIPGFADDLAQRAVLLEMIARTLPLFDEKTPVTRPNLYELYLRKELERQRLKKGRELLLDDHTRFELLQKLAADSYAMEGGGIHCAAAAERVKPKLPPEEAVSAVKTEQHTREFLGCSFLRPGPGDLFIFSHRSFRGYFAAKEFLPRLLDGSARPQPIDQDCIGFLAEMLGEKCTAEFYRRQVKNALAKEGLPQWIEAKNGGYWQRLPGSDGATGMEVEMVYVPAGPFVLGEEGEYALPPQIAVLEKGFWIDKTPVTNAQYREFLKANPKHPAPFYNENWAKPYNWNGREFPRGTGDHPVVLVSWNDAQAFCRWAGKTLPGEQQWEKSARGIDGRRWPWGNAWNRDYCNSASWWAKRDLFNDKDWERWRDEEFLKKLSGKKAMTTSVGDFPENISPYGCVDSAGNVWEWCEDFYDEKQESRVLRGGAWGNPPRVVAGAIRILSQPDDLSLNIGFRCART
ncbi:MAG: SUMF1/EgtB/PvdO family nonheme iron enzyme [Calditrichaceae bacterium]|nr:SUMF1/EgtB/PvdO family nonheme iron enzyme [Calditrichia bacterium]NUQ42340.1 SUMF1/EgtB/PvdO family nonheme iron enzyme [Calditrichaceae bacterium]